MTVDALTGAHAGSAATGDGDVPGDDTYETARTFESLGRLTGTHPGAGR